MILDMRRLCAHCGTEIPDSKRVDAEHCSRACARAAYAQILRAGLLEDKAKRPPCQHCGAAIPASAPAHKVFCGRTCRRLARRARDKAARPVQTCPACGTGFKATIPNQVYCSSSCANNRRQDTPRPCQQCGAVIERPRHDQKHCSNKCRVAAYKARKRATSAEP